MIPVTRAEEIVERLHGIPVSDPYRWLEDEESREVRAWVEAQNAHTARVLDAIPARGEIRAALEKYLSIGTLGTPVVRAGRVFHTCREGKTNQPILYVRDGAQGTDQVLLDPNILSEEGTVALDWWYPSWAGRYVAYGLSAEGSELSTLRVREVTTGKDLPDEIPHTRACSVAWEPTAEGFYYTRYPAPGTVPPGQEMYNRRVYHHTLGQPVSEDPLVFGEGREPDAWPNVAISPDGRWLVVVEAKGWIRTQLYLLDLAVNTGFTPVIEGTEALYGAVPLEDRLLIHTNEGAPNWRVFQADPERPERAHWSEVVMPGEHVLQRIAVAGRKIFAEYLADAASRMMVYGLQGHPEGEIDLPGIGSVYGFDGEPNGDEVYIGFNSFTVPPTVYRYEISAERIDLWKEIDSPVDPAAYEIRQERYASKDGTTIPIFIVHAKGIRRDGNNPTLLTGYGGFNISMTPSFDRGEFVWLERGGIVAVPNLRGGGEYGESWHRDGMLGKKQNVFDDFIAAAEFLLVKRYTRPERLAISGGSNGGLLVGAALTQRPNLFRAVVCSVPLLDMIRYHHFRIARLWIPEFGSAEDEEQFRWLHAYSPYHRVRDATAYPAVLLSTAESDSRVDPMHARKMAARLQAAQAASDRPILLRIETKAGHGAGKPLVKRLDEQTDVWSFLFSEIGVAAGVPAG